MVKKIIIVGLITVVLVGGLFAFYGFSYMKHHTPEMMLNWKVDMLTEELNLEGNQKEELDNLKEMMLTEWNKMREERQVVIEDVVGLIVEEELKQDDLIELITERRDEIDKIVPKFVEQLAVFLKTLNEEQRVRLGEIIRNHSNCSYHSSDS